jgi:hypothetical protein
MKLTRAKKQRQNKGEKEVKKRRAIKNLKHKKGKMRKNEKTKIKRRNQRSWL